VDRHRHRFDADPDPTFCFDADPDPDTDPGPNTSFKHVGKSKFILPFLFTSVPVYIFYLSSQRYRFQNFQYFGQYIEGFLEKKVFLSLIFG
jgi:hypothetical protein